jgi:hypothetical protein
MERIPTLAIVHSEPGLPGAAAIAPRDAGRKPQAPGGG